LDGRNAPELRSTSAHDGLPIQPRKLAPARALAKPFHHLVESDANLFWRIVPFPTLKDLQIHVDR
jgi:hypothetical protein